MGTSPNPWWLSFYPEMASSRSPLFLFSLLALLWAPLTGELPGEESRVKGCPKALKVQVEKVVRRSFSVESEYKVPLVAETTDLKSPFRAELFALRVAEGELVQKDQVIGLLKPLAGALPQTLRSPVVGRVIRLLHREGERVEAGETIAEVGNQQRLLARVKILPEDGPFLLGVSTLEGSFQEIRSGVSPRVLSFDGKELLLFFDNQEEKLSEGFSFRFRVEKKVYGDVLTVKEARPYFNENGEAYFYRVFDGYAEKRTVAVEKVNGEGWVIGEGLREGDEVVTTEDPCLRPGVPLRIMVQDVQSGKWRLRSPSGGWERDLPSWSLETGISYSRLSYNLSDPDVTVSTRSRATPTVALSVERPFMLSRLLVGLRVAWAPKNSLVNLGVASASGSTDLKVNKSFLEISPTVIYSLPMNDKGLALTFGGGIYYALRLSGRWQRLYTLTEKVWEDESSNYWKGQDYGLVGSFGFEGFSVASLPLRLDFRYSHGLRDLAGKLVAGETIRLQSLSITLGTRFSL